MRSGDTQATRSTLQSVDTTLSENITATQDYIPVASTTNFSTSVVAEIESTNEVVSFTDISQNLFQYSEQFDQSYWGKTSVNITANSATAPDGTTTADSMLSTGTGGSFLNVDSSAIPNFATSKTYTVSLFAKAGTSNIIRLANFFSGQTAAWFNLSNGTIGTQNDTASRGITSTITDVGDGWYRITRTYPPTQITGANFVVIGLCDADGSTLSPGSNNNILIWGAQIEEASSATTYLTTTSSNLVGLTGVTRGVNGTTAQAASSGDSIQQLPYALGSIDMPVRLRAISISPDGVGAARLTLCDNNGDTLCDIDVPDGKTYTLRLPEDGILFPNGIFVSNTDNITAYTVYTDKFSGPNLTTTNK